MILNSFASLRLAMTLPNSLFYHLSRKPEQCKPDLITFFLLLANQNKVRFLLTKFSTKVLNSMFLTPNSEFLTPDSFASPRNDAS